MRKTKIFWESFRIKGFKHVPVAFELLSIEASWWIEQSKVGKHFVVVLDNRYNLNGMKTKTLKIKKRIVAEDISHSQDEQRYYCFGKDKKKQGILTVLFTYRENRIRIIDAGYWRKAQKVHEQTNSLQ